MDLQEKIIKEIHTEQKEIECIETNIEKIQRRLLYRIPHHFSIRDIVSAFFGALTIGITFILKGATVRTAVGLDSLHTIIIIIATLVVLFTEIYFIGYSRVRNKSQRKLGQFVTKRLFTLYTITILISFGLVYMLSLEKSEYVNQFSDVIKIVVLVAFPCGIGAAVPSLLQKY